MKDATVSARVENNVKVEAEEILQKLGVPVSVVINSLYRQIIYHHGVPFSLTVPLEPKTVDTMSGSLMKNFSIATHSLFPGKEDRCASYLKNWKGAFDKWTPMK